jgi:tRNA/rRNA methyltransferase
MGRASKGRATATAAPVVILVRPQLGDNIGMAARAASGADVVLEKATLFDTVAAAVADLERVVATTARNRELTQRILTPRRAASEMRGWIGEGEKVGILFGPERTGLTNDDMVHADTALSIPLNPQFSSLNIAQAVLLVAYEWAAAGEETPADRMSEHATRPATKDELLNLFAHLERALDQSGFLRNKAMRPAMVHNLRAFLQRAAMTEQEVRSFHGVIKYLAKHKHSEE